MSRRSLAILFAVLLAFFVGIVKLVDFIVVGEPVPVQFADFRFPLFWAAIGTWAIYASKKKQQDNKQGE